MKSPPILTSILLVIETQAVMDRLERGDFSDVDPDALDMMLVFQKEHLGKDHDAGPIFLTRPDRAVS